MAYLIRRKEPLADEVRRILLEQNRKALALLDAWDEAPRERVHAARQAFKRQRALLRLIRPAARYVFEVENGFYRDVARSLASLRDTDAVLEAIALLEGRCTDDESLASLRRLRQELGAHADSELSDPGLDPRDRIGSACSALREASRRLGRTPLPDLDRHRLRRATRKTLRRCEHGLGRVLITGLAEDFHAWRRDVKCAYHQARLLQEIDPDWAAAWGSPLGELAELLGHAHDLVVLEARLRQSAARIPEEDRRRVQHITQEARASLEEQARHLGVRIFLQPPARDGGPPTDSAADSAANVAQDDASLQAPSAAATDTNVVDFTAHRNGQSEAG
jgi:CHAD domain-containing protein